MFEDLVYRYCVSQTLPIINEISTYYNTGATFVSSILFSVLFLKKDPKRKKQVGPFPFVFTSLLVTFQILVKKNLPTTYLTKSPNVNIVHFRFLVRWRASNDDFDSEF